MIFLLCFFVLRQQLSFKSPRSDDSVACKGVSGSRPTDCARIVAYSNVHTIIMRYVLTAVSARTSTHKLGACFKFWRTPSTWCTRYCFSIYQYTWYVMYQERAGRGSLKPFFFIFQLDFRKTSP